MNGATKAFDRDPIDTTDDARAAIPSRPFPTCSCFLRVPSFCLDGNVRHRPVEKEGGFCETLATARTFRKYRSSGAAHRAVVDSSTYVANSDIDEVNVITEKSEVLTEKSEVLTEKSEVLTEKSEVFIEKSEVFIEKSEVFTEKSEVLTEKSEVFTEKSEVLTEKSEVFTEKSEVFTEKSEVLTEKSEVFIEKNLRLDLQLVEQRELLRATMLRRLVKLTGFATL